MSSALALVLGVGLFSIALLACLPWVLRASPEAERMFALVQSTREDKRRIGPLERAKSLLSARTQQVRLRLGKQKNEAMRKRFAQAGWRSRHAPDLFFWCQAVSTLAGALLGSRVSSSPIFYLFVGALAGFAAPDLWLGVRQRRRQDRLRRSLPDMADLLVICVGAGLGLDQALLRVAAELKIAHPELQEEMERVLLERGAGVSRNDALRAMVERTRVEELAHFASMLAETDRFGSPILAALTQFSDELRTRRRQHAEEAAAKTKVKIIFPLVLCIFPCIFLVLLVPAALTFLHGFGSMAH